MGADRRQGVDVTPVLIEGITSSNTLLGQQVGQLVAETDPSLNDGPAQISMALRANVGAPLAAPPLHVALPWRQSRNTHGTSRVRAAACTRPHVCAF